MLRWPSGRSMLIDAGLAREGYDSGERIVAPFLWFFGVTRIDRLVLTHAHPDHAGGVPFLLHAFRPAEVWEGIAPLQDRGYEAFQTTLEQNRTTRRCVSW